MSNNAGFDFTQFVPGFDFLKNLGAGSSGSSSAASAWVAPTLDPEELDKRIQELKTVQFWLEQNAKALGATIQALEVQRMTLSTLKSMNMNFQDMVDAAKPAAAPDPAAAAPGVDPAQWWNALTQQFQNIASQAVQDMGQHAQAHAAPSAGKAQPKAKSATQTARKPAAKTAAKRKSVKPAGR